MKRWFGITLAIVVAAAFILAAPPVRLAFSDNTAKDLKTLKKNEKVAPGKSLDSKPVPKTNANSAKERAATRAEDDPIGTKK